jgi:hypothetical protein
MKEIRGTSLHHADVIQTVEVVFRRYQHNLGLEKTKNEPIHKQEDFFKNETSALAFVHCKTTILLVYTLYKLNGSLYTVHWIGIGRRW